MCEFVLSPTDDNPIRGYIWLTELEYAFLIPAYDHTIFPFGRDHRPNNEHGDWRIGPFENADIAKCHYRKVHFLATKLHNAAQEPEPIYLGTIIGAASIVMIGVSIYNHMPSWMAGLFAAPLVIGWLHQFNNQEK